MEGVSGKTASHIDDRGAALAMFLTGKVNEIITTPTHITKHALPLSPSPFVHLLARSTLLNDQHQLKISFSNPASPFAGATNHIHG